MYDRFTIRHPDGRSYKMKSLAAFQRLYEPDGFEIVGDIDGLNLEPDEDTDDQPDVEDSTDDSEEEPERAPEQRWDFSPPESEDSE